MSPGEALEQCISNNLKGCFQGSVRVEADLQLNEFYMTGLDEVAEVHIPLLFFDTD